MLQLLAGKDASEDKRSVRFERHRPELTLLYRLVEQYYPDHAEHLVAFSCKRRGFCPSCGARRMAEGAALLVDEVLPHKPMRQWVLSVPFPLRFLFATHLTHKAGYTKATAHPGAVTLIQRFGSALNLNIHFHMLFLDGVYVGEAESSARFRWVKAPTSVESHHRAPSCPVSGTPGVAGARC